MRFPVTLGIRAVVVILSTLVACASGAILVVTSAAISREVTESESAGVLRALGKEVASQLGRSLNARWRELEGLRNFAQQDIGATELRQRLETIARIGERYAWIGVARPDGQVTVASGGLLEGLSVAERAWFRAGLQGPFAGDVRDAILLQRLVAPNAEEPLRLIDHAMPIRRPDGSVAGVIASHVSWATVREVIQEALSGSGRDAVLVSRDGTVLVGPPEVEGRAPALPSLLAARQGVARTLFETWPDGESYLSTVITPIPVRDVPGFGWSVVVRQKAEAAAAPARAITRRLAISLSLVAGVVFLGSLVVGAAVVRPLRRLRDSATALAEGTLDGPVPDLRSYREVRDVADALARLQARLADPASDRAAARRRPSLTEAA